MNRFKIICCFIFFISHCTFSQTDKGRFFLGASVFSGGVTNNTSEYTNPAQRVEARNVNFGISPSVGKFMANNLLVGVGVQASFNYGKVLGQTDLIKKSDSNDANYSIGPFIQYFFGKNEKGKPFIQFSTRAGIRKSESGSVYADASKYVYQSTERSIAATLNLGYAVFLNDSFILSFYSGYSYSHYNSDRETRDPSGNYGSTGKISNSGIAFGASISTTFRKKQD